MEFQTIGIKEVEKRLRDKDTRLVDVRTREEYGLYHLEGAVNVPYQELDAYKEKLSKNITYILYCERGSTSLLAAKALGREGYRVYTVIGGIRAWEESHLN